MISSKTLREERRIRMAKALSEGFGKLALSLIGIMIGIGMLWIIQVGVTSI